MITVRFRAKFIRMYKKLPVDLQLDVKDKIKLFSENPKDPMLRIHKLHGRLKGSLSFSVNYRYRVVFEWEKKNSVVALLAVGDHDVYK